jgi:hypothetical protein
MPCALVVHIQQDREGGLLCRPNRQKNSLGSEAGAVEAGRFNSPTLEGLFNLVIAAEEARSRLSGEQERALETVFAANWSANSLKQYHSKNEEIGANEIGEAACAGALFVILSNILSRFRNDTRASQELWAKGEPLINGVSLGILIRAAANNFRHYDEWRSASAPTAQQLASMEVLLKALTMPPQIIRENVCPKVIKIISNGDFGYLNDSLFEFAKSIASAPRTRSIAAKTPADEAGYENKNRGE